MPFTPELHKLVKKALKENVEVISSLRGQNKSKLSFNMATGKFSTEINGFFGRKKSPDDAPPDIRNQRKEDGIDSATNQNRFEFPLLITFYELRKLDLNIKNKKTAKEGNPYNERLKNNVIPDKAFKDVCAALVYLRDVTYTGLLKGNQRNAITDILLKATKLEESTTQPQLDRHLAEWIHFVTPDDIKLIVTKTYDMLKDKYRGSVRSFQYEPSGNKIGGVEVLANLIYKEIYSSGGASYDKDKVVEAKEKTYAQNIKTKLNNNKGIRAILQDTCVFNKDTFVVVNKFKLATLDDFIGDTALDILNYTIPDNLEIDPSERCKSIGFCHFLNDQWKTPSQNVKARVYIRFKHEEDGASALAGLDAIIEYLKNAGSSIRDKFYEFKICDIEGLRTRTDSIVMYCADMETARSIGSGLAKTLLNFVKPPLPKGVREIFPGIGWATQPESEFNPIRFKRLAPYVKNNFSYGTHRSGLIAKGFIISGVAPNFKLPAIETCLKKVALAFSDAGVEFFKPHHTGSLPPLPPPLS